MSELIFSRAAIVTLCYFGLATLVARLMQVGAGRSIFFALLNIVAVWLIFFTGTQSGAWSMGQTPNFIGISQIAGSQMEALSTGLPTINIGPHQTQAQQIYSITNSVSSTVNGSYQASPLVTTSFQEGMLAPIDFKEIALLVSSHPREIVVHAVIDSITLSSNIGTSTYWNDPSDNSDSGSDHLQITATCESALSDTDYRWTKQQMFLQPSTCNYAKFVRWLQLLDDYGLSAQLVPAANSGQKAPTAPSPATNAVNITSSKGSSTTGTPTSAKTAEMVRKLCFDPTLKSAQFTHFNPSLACDAPAGSNHAAEHAPFSADFHLLGYGVIKVDNLKLRSPLGVIDYMAKAWRNSEPVPFETGQTKQFIGPLMEIVSGSGPQCYASTRFQSESWCVPQEAEKTAVLMDIVQQLRNLSITPTDLNAAFTVRIGG